MQILCPYSSLQSADLHFITVCLQRKVLALLPPSASTHHTADQQHSCKNILARTGLVVSSDTYKIPKIPWKFTSSLTNYEKYNLFCIFSTYFLFFNLCVFLNSWYNVVMRLKKLCKIKPFHKLTPKERPC